MDKKKVINIIAPIYNEEDNIDQLISQLGQFADGQPNYDFRFVLVNDGSSDNSHKVIMDVTDQRLHYIKFARNFGKEIAMLAGLDYSVNADAAVIIDSDLQMPIRYINDLITNWEQGIKLTVCAKKERDTSHIRGFLAQRYYSVFKKITKQPIIKDALDFTFMDNQVIKEVVKNRETSRFFKGIIASVGFEPAILEIEIDDRVNGESSYGTFRQLFSYAFVSLAPYTKLPLYIAIYAGIISALIGFIYGIIIVIQYLDQSTTVAGYSSIMCVLLFFFGIILIVLGIIGFYIGLILDEVRKKPLYIVEQQPEDEC